MIRAWLATFVFAACLALPTQAFDLGDMTDDERASFRAEVRAYLLDNPEVLMEAIAVLENREARAQANAEADIIAANADTLFNNPDSWVGGNPAGDITMVEFLDYRCSFCRRAHPEVVELLETDGNIRLIVKEFPILGEQSTQASRFALSTKLVAGDDAYKQVHDALITLRADINERALTRIARDLDLDADAILNGMDDPRIDQILATNQALATALGISGTPTFVVEDEMLRGFLPLDGLRQVVAALRGSR